MVFSPLQLQSSHTLRSFEGLYTATMLVTLWIIGALILSNLRTVRYQMFCGSFRQAVHWFTEALANWACPCGVDMLHHARFT
jgi:beta-lactamase regulating signal transducer with metallopeptidase domain